MGTQPMIPPSSSLLAAISSASGAEFHDVAAAAASLGRPAIPALMLLARDGVKPMGRLCAICALGRMVPRVPLAREALRRISGLPRIGFEGYVVQAAIPDPQWPFDGHWNAYDRLEGLSDHDRNPPPTTRTPTVKHGGRPSRRSQPNPEWKWTEVRPADGWWREQE
jgi:hypothetical protein